MIIYSVFRHLNYSTEKYDKINIPVYVTHKAHKQIDALNKKIFSCTVSVTRPEGFLMAYCHFIKLYFDGKLSEHDINETIAKNKTRPNLEIVLGKFLSEADLEVEKS